jgi:hypothetical protein
MRRRDKRRGARNPLHMNSNITVGKYLVSPLISHVGESLYGASVSIKRGAGSTCTDWILRFTNRFDSAEAAGCYATQQGISWIHGRAATA